MVEIEIVPEMEQTLRETIKNIDMSMRDITEGDFEDPEKEKKDSDLEVEEINIVQRAQALKVRIQALLIFSLQAENQQLRDTVAKLTSDQGNSKEEITLLDSQIKDYVDRIGQSFLLETVQPNQKA